MSDLDPLNGFYTTIFAAISIEVWFIPSPKYFHKNPQPFSCENLIKFIISTSPKRTIYSDKISVDMNYSFHSSLASSWNNHRCFKHVMMKSLLNMTSDLTPSLGIRMHVHIFFSSRLINIHHIARPCTSRINHSQRIEINFENSYFHAPPKVFIIIFNYNNFKNSNSNLLSVVLKKCVWKHQLLAICFHKLQL